MASCEFTELQVRFSRKLRCVRSTNPSSGASYANLSPPRSVTRFRLRSARVRSAHDANALANTVFPPTRDAAVVDATGGFTR
eukprot:1178315-Prorocentrum_minimum.AAC.2